MTKGRMVINNTLQLHNDCMNEKQESEKQESDNT